MLRTYTYAYLTLKHYREGGAIISEEMTALIEETLQWAQENGVTDDYLISEELRMRMYAATLEKGRAVL